MEDDEDNSNPEPAEDGEEVNASIKSGESSPDAVEGVADQSQDELSAELKELRKQSRTAAKQAQNAAKKAEAEHGEVKALVGRLEESVTDADSLKESVKDLLEELEGLQVQHSQLTQVAAHLESVQSDVDGQLEQIREAKGVFDQTVADANEASEQVGQSQTEAERLRDEIRELHETTNSSAAEVDADATQTSNLVAEAKVDTQAVKEARQARKQESEDFNRYVNESKREIGELLKKAEEVLSSSTTASLASSYDEEAKRAKCAMKVWAGIIFLLAAGISVILYCSADAHFGENSQLDKHWATLLVFWLSRGAIVATLSTVLVFCMRHFAVVRRDYQLYAHKETSSRAFEGYRREISDVDDGRHVGKFVSQAIALFGMNPFTDRGESFDHHGNGKLSDSMRKPQKATSAPAASDVDASDS